MRTDFIFKRTMLLFVGFLVMAFGVALSIKADLGTSPVSSLPYVTSLTSGMTVGITSIIVNTLLVLLQILILRKAFSPLQLLQIPGVIAFGLMIDLASFIISPISISTYLNKWMLCVAGILLVAIGVSFEINAKFITMAGEGVVLSIVKVTGAKFSNVKMMVDLSLVLLSVLVSLLFLKSLHGVREGTIAAAVFVGLITKRTNKIVEKLIQPLFASDTAITSDMQ